MRPTLRKSAIVLCLAGFFAVNVEVVWQVRQNIADGYSDFASFYTAGKILRQGEGARLYDPKLQWEVQQQFAANVKVRQGPLPYVRPPFEAILFLPLAYLKYPDACLVWMMLQVLLLGAVSFVIRKMEQGCAEPWPVLFCILVALAFAPAAFSLRQGQDSILLLLVLTLAWASLRRGAEFRSGVFLGLGLFKFHLMIPMLAVFLLRRKFKTFLAFLITGLCLAAVSVFLVGWPTLIHYPKQLWELAQAPGSGMVDLRYMPTLRGWTAGQGWLSNSTAGNWVLWGVQFLSVLLAAAFFRRDGTDYESIDLGFSFLIVVVLLTSYYGYSYDLTLLLLPVLVLGQRYLQRPGPMPWTVRLFWLCVAVLWFSPLYWVTILRVGQCYWLAPVLLLMAVSLGSMLLARKAAHAVPRA